MSDNIRVFISYSHDSPEHAQRVLALSERLRNDGIDAHVDQYINGTPLGGWARWMLDEVEKADFVLLVCTETYYRRFRGHEEPNKGKGADWEGALITQDLYDARSQTVKFVPILFDFGDERYIPEPLRPFTHYTLNSEPAYEQLYDFLLGQAGVEPGGLGIVRRKERKRAEPLAFPAETADAAPAPTLAAHSSAALELWQEKLAFLLSEEAVAVDPDQKFRLRKLIDEAKAKVREHGDRP
jgi:hypothetical protein